MLTKPKFITKFKNHIIDNKIKIINKILFNSILNNIKQETPKKILVNTHSNLNYLAGDTIMISNFIKLFQDCNWIVTLITEYKINNKNFRSNIDLNNIEIIESINPIQYIEGYNNNYDLIFIRNHSIIDKLIGKTYLNKTILYGLDVHLDPILKLNNNFVLLLTQSEELKQKYIDKGVNEDKILIKEPIAYKYNFNLPERKDNEIRLIYCGTLRDEENILEI